MKLLEVKVNISHRPTGCALRQPHLRLDLTCFQGAIPTKGSDSVQGKHVPESLLAVIDMGRS